MKFIVILKTVMAAVSCLCIFRAFYFSKIYGYRAAARSVAYLLAPDKRLFELIVRISLVAILVMNCLMLSYLINRIVLHFPPYVNDWVLFTSVLMSLAMLTVSGCTWLVYDQKSFNFLLKLLQKTLSKKNEFPAN